MLESYANVIQTDRLPCFPRGSPQTSPNPLAAAVERMRLTGSGVRRSHGIEPDRGGLRLSAVAARAAVGGRARCATIRSRSAFRARARRSPPTTTGAACACPPVMSSSPRAAAKATRCCSSCCATPATRCSCRTELPAVRAPDASRQRRRRGRTALDYHGVWPIDLDTWRRDRPTRTRAVLVVSPNNPTGRWLQRDELDWPRRRCARRTTWRSSVTKCSPTIPSTRRPARHEASSSARRRAVVQPWRAVEVGRPAAVEARLDGAERPAPRCVQGALMRLELIADTYLSVSTPVQVAATRLLEEGRDIRAADSPARRAELPAR